MGVRIVGHGFAPSLMRLAGRKLRDPTVSYFPQVGLNTHHLSGLKTDGKYEKLQDPTVSYFPPSFENSISPSVLLLLPSECTVLVEKESPGVLGLDEGFCFLGNFVRLGFEGESIDSCNHCSLLLCNLTPVIMVIVIL